MNEFLRSKTNLASLVIFLLIATSSRMLAQVAFKNVQLEIGKAFATYPNTAGWGDIDNDGDLDVYMAVGSTKGFDLMINDLNSTGRFLRGDTLQPYFVRTAGPRSVVMADVENDGDLDMMAIGQDTQIWLILNKLADTSTLTFEDISDATGIAHTGEAYYCCSMADYDNDGLLDILVTGLSKNAWNPTLLFHNTTPAGGSVSFEEVADYAGILSALGMSMVTGSWADYDNDGDQDLFIITSDNAPVFLYQNQSDGTFLDVTVEAGFGSSLGDSRAAVWGDYDNDSDLDIFIGRRPNDNHPGADKCQLFRNDGGVFTEVESARITGVVFYGVASADYDNDGDLDLHLLNSEGADYMLRNDGNNVFVDVANQVGLVKVQSPGGWGLMDINDRGGQTWADWDADGDLDLLLPGGDGQFPYLMRNDGGNANNWLELRLVGLLCNRSAVGARVTVRSGNLRQIREISAGGGYISGPPLDVHVGLGQRTVVDSLIIRWPNGSFDLFLDIHANQILTIEQGSGISAVEKKEIAVVGKFSLSQNYPNPFNSQTNISYYLSEPGNICLEIYSPLGQKIKTIEKIHQSSGREVITFKADHLTSGVYIYRLVAGNFVQQKKMLLIK